MVRIIEYINKKKYMWDTKMGRQWRVLGGAGPKEGGEDSGKWRGTARPKKEKEIQAWYNGFTEDLQVSEVHLIPYQEAPICEVS